MQTIDFTPTEATRPLKRHSIVSMVNSLDTQAASIKAGEPASLDYFSKVCREMLYRGTDTDPTDLLDSKVAARMLDPKSSVVNELGSMCIDLLVINDERGIGWTITHTFSGIVGTLLIPRFGE